MKATWMRLCEKVLPAGRRDLILALGFDDEIQQRFIRSAGKRQAAYTLLQGDRDRTSQSQIPGERLAETLLAPFARFDAQSARIAAESADLRSSSGHAMDSLNTNPDMTDVAINRKASAPGPAVSIKYANRMRSSLIHV